MIHLPLSSIIKNQAIHNIGCIGHVSNGKSTLVKALTGIKTQKFEKEKERNITIHLGYANSKIFYSPDDDQYFFAPSNTSEFLHPTLHIPLQLIYHISLVDCPGHESYMATMISGSGIMDSAILVEAANASIVPQPQTLEHLIAMNYTNVEKILVVQNKIDLVSRSDAQKNFEKIQDFTDSCLTSSLPIIPISAQLNTNISHVGKWIATQTHTDLTRLNTLINRPLQMSIIRTFDINRPHTSIDLLSGGIIGGSLSSGYVSVGDILEIRPGILTITKGKWFSRPFFTIVKSIHTEKNQFDTAFPGGLIAIGTTLDPGYCKSDKLVGQIVSRPGHHHDMFSKLELKMTTIRRPNDTSKISSKYAENEKIMICINSDSIPATILRYNEKTKTALVKLDRPTILNKDTIVSVMKRITGTFKLFSVADILSLEDKVEVIYDEDLPSLEPIKEFEIIDDIGHSPKETSWDYASFWDDSLKQVKIHKAIIPFPSLTPENKNTKWANYNELLSLIAKSQDLVFNDKLPKSCDSASLITPSVLKAMITNFVEKEMSTEIHPNEDGEAIIKGRFKPNDLHHVLGTWVTKYQNCPVCSSCYSYLFREDRILFKSCLDCLSKTAIS